MRLLCTPRLSRLRRAFFFGACLSACKAPAPIHATRPSPDPLVAPPEAIDIESEAPEFESPTEPSNDEPRERPPIQARDPIAGSRPPIFDLGPDLFIHGKGVDHIAGCDSKRAISSEDSPRVYEWQLPDGQFRRQVGALSPSSLMQTIACRSDLTIEARGDEASLEGHSSNRARRNSQPTRTWAPSTRRSSCAKPSAKTSAFVSKSHQ